MKSAASPIASGPSTCAVSRLLLDPQLSERRGDLDLPRSDVRLGLRHCVLHGLGDDGVVLVEWRQVNGALGKPEDAVLPALERARNKLLDGQIDRRGRALHG